MEERRTGVFLGTADEIHYGIKNIEVHVQDQTNIYGDKWDLSIFLNFLNDYDAPESKIVINNLIKSYPIGDMFEVTYNTKNMSLQYITPKKLEEMHKMVG